MSRNNLAELMKRLDALERSAGASVQDQLEVTFQDGSKKKMGLLDFTCALCTDQQQNPPISYRPLGEIKGQMLKSIADQLLEKGEKYERTSKIGPSSTCRH